MTPSATWQRNAEVFTPPYLFNKDGSGTLAARPTISSAPGTVNYGAPLQVSTPNAAAIRKSDWSGSDRSHTR